MSLYISRVADGRLFRMNFSIYGCHCQRLINELDGLLRWCCRITSFRRRWDERALKRRLLVISEPRASLFSRYSRILLYALIFLFRDISRHNIMPSLTALRM